MMACWRETIRLDPRQIVVSGVRPIVAVLPMVISNGSAWAGLMVSFAPMRLSEHKPRIWKKRSFERTRLTLARLTERFASRYVHLERAAECWNRRRGLPYSRPAFEPPHASA